MKTVILGAGTIIPDFLKAAAEIESIELYGIYGRESSQAAMEKFQAQYNITHIFNDYERVLNDENVELIYVALPNSLHYNFTKQALEHGKHVIVEKPFTSNYQQAEELFAIAENNGLFLFEAITNQYNPNFDKTKELVRNIGDIKIVQLNYSQYSRRYDSFKQGEILPVFDPKKSGGALMDLNVYNIHFVTGLLGMPKDIHYYANIERGIDTSGIFVMEYEKFQCVCIGAKDCKAPLSINVQGDKGYIHSDEPANVYGSFSFCDNSGNGTEYCTDDERPRMYYELKRFTDYANSKDYESFAIAGQHTLDVMQILDTARRQAKIDFGG